MCQHSVHLMSTPRNVIHHCPRCSRDVSALFPFCQHSFRYVSTLFPLCQHAVPVPPTLCSRQVNTLIPLCQQLVTSFTTARAVPVVSTPCLPDVNNRYRQSTSPSTARAPHHFFNHTHTLIHTYTPPPPNPSAPLPAPRHTHTLKTDNLVMIYDALL